MPRGERGLIGIALHPDFASNGYVYIYSTRTDGGSHNRISRFTAAGDVAAAGSEIALVDLPNLSGATDPQRRRHALRQRRQALRRRRRQRQLGAGTEPGEPVRQAAALQRGRHDPDRQPVLRHPERPGARDLGARACATRSPSRCSPAPAGSTSTTSARTPGKRSTSAWPAPTTAGRPPKGPSSFVAGFVTAPLFTYPHSDPSPPGSGPGGFITGSAVAGGAFYPADGPFPAGYRDQYYFADFISKFVGRLDSANGNAVYTFARLSASPVDLLVGTDGALYVLTRSGITRISAP